jgi:hypothetical protein
LGGGFPEQWLRTERSDEGERRGLRHFRGQADGDEADGKRDSAPTEDLLEFCLCLENGGPVQPGGQRDVVLHSATRFANSPMFGL